MFLIILIIQIHPNLWNNILRSHCLKCTFQTWHLENNPEQFTFHSHTGVCLYFCLNSTKLLGLIWFLYDEDVNILHSQKGYCASTSWRKSSSLVQHFAYALSLLCTFVSYFSQEAELRSTLEEMGLVWHDFFNHKLSLFVPLHLIFFCRKLSSSERWKKWAWPDLLLRNPSSTSCSTIFISADQGENLVALD